MSVPSVVLNSMRKHPENVASSAPSVVQNSMRRQPVSVASVVLSSLRRHLENVASSAPSVIQNSQHTLAALDFCSVFACRELAQCKRHNFRLAARTAVSVG